MIESAKAPREMAQAYVEAVRAGYADRAQGLAEALRRTAKTKSDTERATEMADGPLFKHLSALVDTGDVTDENAVNAVRAADAAADDEPESPVPTSAVDWLREPPPRQWLVDNLIPAGRLSALYGDGEAGKSRLLLQLACAVIQDEDGYMLPWDADRAIERVTRNKSGVVAVAEPPLVRRHGYAVLVTWEDEPEEMVRRIWMAGRAGALPEPTGAFAAQLQNHLYVVNMREIGGPLWAPHAGSRHTSTEGTWTRAGHAVLARMAEDGPVLMAIDPIAAAFACSENDRALVRRFLTALDQAAEDTGCTVVLAGHPPKGRGDDTSSYSGSTDWRNGVRAMLTIELETTGYVLKSEPSEQAPKAPMLKRDKNSYGAARESVWLKSHWVPPREERGPELAWFMTDAEGAAEHVAGEPVVPDPLKPVPKKSKRGGTPKKTNGASRPAGPRPESMDPTVAW